MYGAVTMLGETDVCCMYYMDLPFLSTRCQAFFSRFSVLPPASFSQIASPGLPPSPNIISLSAFLFLKWGHKHSPIPNPLKSMVGLSLIKTGVKREKRPPWLLHKRVIRQKFTDRGILETSKEQTVNIAQIGSSALPTQLATGASFSIKEMKIVCQALQFNCLTRDYMQTVPSLSGLHFGWTLIILCRFFLLPL